MVERKMMCAYELWANYANEIIQFRFPFFPIV